MIKYELTIEFLSAQG